MPPEKLKKMFLIIATNALLLYAALLAGMFLAQRAMIYFPSRTIPDLVSYGAAEHMQIVSITTADNLMLKGWYAPPENPDMPVIALFHGNAAEHGIRFYIMRPYLEAGYGVLLAGYRGYGGNPGKPSENGFYTDARAWIDNLLESGIKADQIILYGESIGTGVATQMALEYKDAMALVLQSPYTRLSDIARKRYFFLPVDLLMLDRFNNIDKISHIDMPVLILHGTLDGIIPVTHVTTLYEKAKEPKQLRLFEGYGHNDLPVEERAEVVTGFLQKN